MVISYLTSSNNIPSLIQFARSSLFSHSIIERHLHPSMTEIFFVESGTCTFWIDENQIIELINNNNNHHVDVNPLEEGQEQERQEQERQEQDQDMADAFLEPAPLLPLSSSALLYFNNH